MPVQDAQAWVLSHDAPSHSTADASKLAMTDAALPSLKHATTLPDGVPKKRTVPPRSWILAVCISLPLAIFLGLRPERYSLTPNSLDPVFYTGYAMNLDDILNAAGDRHYFVTRWTTYYPVYLIDQLVGSVAGRLLWRWLLAGMVVFALLELGRRLGWRRSVAALVSLIVLTMPVFLRAFLTDYVEYLVVSLGVCLVVLCLRERQTTATAGGIGLLAAAILIANPIAIFVVAPPCLFALFLERGGWRRRIGLVLLGSIMATATIVFGLLLFRFRYGIANVYEPSIRFMQTYAGGPDALKSPNLEWLGRFTWLYAPPVILAVALGMSIRRKGIWSRVEVAALALSAVQYTLQWIDQFIRDGNGLEISYYWSNGLPAHLVAMSVVVARLYQFASARVIATTAGIWVVLLLTGIPSPLRLPAAWSFAGLMIVFLAVVLMLVRSRPALGAGALLVGVLWMQIGAPPYDPSSYHFFNASPRYDEIIWMAGDLSDVVLDEAVWFARQMDRVPNDASASFISAGTWSSPIAGLYAPHVTGRMIFPEQGFALADESIREMRAGTRPVVAIYGEADQVGAIYADLGQRVTLSPPILDVTRDRGLRYRLVVLSMADATRLPFTWSADILPRVGGEAIGTAVEAAPPEPAGILTYGPYLGLPKGRYKVTFRYSADAPLDALVGSGDVAVAAGAQIEVVDLYGTDARSVEVSVSFEAPEGANWEFRSFWNGTAPIAIESITLARDG